MNNGSRIFCDMDGVLADFEALLRMLNTTGERLKNTPGAYASLKPIPGAIEAVRSLIGMGFELWIASKPATGLPGTYSDKVRWILEYLPELKRRIILTHDKGLLGSERDFLIDDRPHKANCEQFRGTLIRFNCAPHYRQWPDVLSYFRHVRESGHAN